MRTLLEIRTDIHKGCEYLYGLKSKAAKHKQVEKLEALRMEGWDAMQAVFKDGDKITLDHMVGCTAPSGGGWGCRGTVTVIDVGSTSLTVDCNNQVLYIEVLEDWKRWGQDSFYGFQSFLKSRGQSIDDVCRQREMELTIKHLNSALKCRNALSVVDHKPLRKSKHFQSRIYNMISHLRELRGAS